MPIDSMFVFDARVQRKETQKIMPQSPVPGPNCQMYPLEMPHGEKTLPKIRPALGSGKKKAHTHKLFGRVALGRPQEVPATKPGFLLILHQGKIPYFTPGTNQACPWDNPGDEGRQKSSCVKSYVPFSLAIGGAMDWRRMEWPLSKVWNRLFRGRIPERVLNYLEPERLAVRKPLAWSEIAGKVCSSPTRSKRGRTEKHANARKRAQKSANASLQKSAKERKRAQ